MKNALTAGTFVAILGNNRDRRDKRWVNLVAAISWEVILKALDCSESRELIVGDAVEVAGLKIIPVAHIYFGIGSFDYQGEGLGIGCQMSPKWLLVVTEDEVHTLSMGSYYTKNL